MICRAIHSAVGLLVTVRDNNRRRSCRRMTRTNNSLKPTVGTIRKSMAPMPAEWLCRKVFQVCDRPRPPFAMYLATVDCATSIPSFRSSPWMRGAPHSRLARLISRIRRRISAGTLGRPHYLHRSKVQGHTCLGSPRRAFCAGRQARQVCHMGMAHEAFADLSFGRRYDIERKFEGGPCATVRSRYWLCLLD